MNADLVRLAVLDVGQGDTIVLTHPASGEAIVVDCIDEFGVLDYLSSQRVREVKALVLTHLHSDHYRRAVSFLENCEANLGRPCHRVVLNPFPDKEPKSPPPDEDCEHLPGEYGRLLRWLELNEESCWTPAPVAELPIEGELARRIEFLHPYPALLPRSRALGYNNSSIVLRVRGQGSSALLTGDIEAAGWELMVNRHGLAKADVLKFPHHGAWKERAGTPADPKAFLNAVGARTVVFSVGSHQKGYNHPDTHVFEAVRKSGAGILCTQATARCGLKSPNAQRAKTMEALTRLQEASEIAPEFCQDGTPCAGTVIIDLAEIPIIRNPNPLRHRKDVVEGLFAAEHQC